MTAIPEPSRAHAPDARTVLASQIGTLSGRQARDALRWLARDPSPVITTSVRGAVLGQVAAAGLDDGPRWGWTRQEPPCAENWFCSCCLGPCVGGRTADGVCAGCKDTRGAAA